MKTAIPDEIDAINGIGSRFPIPPFRVTDRQVEPALPLALPMWPDAILELDWNGMKRRFCVEYKRLASPKQLEFAISQVRRYGQQSDLPPLLVAPYFSDEALKRLVDEGVSAIDLSGNYAIVVPGKWLVWRTGADNKFPANASIKNVYRGKSSLVTRALMLEGQFESAEAIRKKLEGVEAVSPATISKVLSQLEEQLMIERNGAIRVVQPLTLLDKLTANFERPVEKDRWVGKVVSPEKLEAIAEGASRSDVKYAVADPEPYVIRPTSNQVVRVYVQSIDKLLSALPTEENSRFPNVELIETIDSAAFFGRRLRKDVFWISPLQAYLELAAGDKRDKQAADSLRDDILKFRYRDA